LEINLRKETAKAVWDLMRLEHGIMLAIAVIIGAVIAGKGILFWDKLLYGCLTALFLEAATFALNDYCDLEIDKKNKRLDRPLVRGDILPKYALLLFYILFPIGLTFAWFVNLSCFIIALITGFLAIIYDIKMKKIKLIGNFYIAYTMAIPFVFGGAVISSNIPIIVYIIAGIAFLTGSGREIMKDVMDFTGDKAGGVKSLPMYIGKNKSIAITIIFYLLAIIVSFFPFIFLIDAAYYYDYLYLFIVLIADILFAYTCIDLIRKKEEHIATHRKITLLAMFSGLIAFLIGGFI
jgi:geranylgeranylglycerol-phosphate geranylgeranyltransferase